MDKAQKFRLFSNISLRFVRQLIEDMSGMDLRSKV